MIKISITRKNDGKGKPNWVMVGLGLMVGLILIVFFIYLLDSGLLSFQLGK